MKKLGLYVPNEEKSKEKKIFIDSWKPILSAENINLPNAKRIYINEQLSRFNFNLLNHAKSLKQHGYNYKLCLV